MSYDPNERIHILQNLSRAMIRLEQIGTSDERISHEQAAMRARDYLRAYDIYLATSEPVVNHRVVSNEQ